MDVKTGQNAGVKTISAAWGFRTEEELKAAGAEVIIREPWNYCSLYKRIRRRME